MGKVFSMGKLSQLQAISLLRNLLRPVYRGLREMFIRRGDFQIKQTASRATVSIRVTNSPNNDWTKTNRGMTISVKRQPILAKGANIFAMGSCFAEEIRSALRGRGYSVYPRYFDIDLDHNTQKIAELPDRDNINHYDTFTIRQEFEKAFDGKKPDAEDLWEVSPGRFSNLQSGKKVFRDPHRKLVFGVGKDRTLDVTSKLDKCIGDGVLKADVYIITLGLIEVWKNLTSGKYLCQGRPGLPNTEFIESSFESNLDNMRRVCNLIGENFPEKKVVLTVSPVPLYHTFTSRDIIVANMESKSLLRTVAGQIDREFDNVIYWPSYEISTRDDVYEADGRHVTREAVAKIIDAFLAAHCA